MRERGNVPGNIAVKKPPICYDLEFRRQSRCATSKPQMNQFGLGGDVYDSGSPSLETLLKYATATRAVKASNLNRSEVYGCVERITRLRTMVRDVIRYAIALRRAQLLVGQSMSFFSLIRWALSKAARLSNALAAAANSQPTPNSACCPNLKSSFTNKAHTRSNLAINQQRCLVLRC